MATWKKVHVEDADTVHGKITATLTDGSDIAANTAVQLVFSDGAANQENELKTTTLSLGSMAFADTSDYELGSDTLTSANFAADLLTGTAAGTGGITVTDGDNVLFGADTDDVTIDLSINALVTTVASSSDIEDTDFLAFEDATDSKTKRATIANIIAAASAGVTTFNAGRNLTEADGDTSGVIDLDLDINLVDVNSVQAEGAEDGTDLNTGGTDLVLKGGASTGNVGGGNVELRVTPASGSGTDLNAHAVAVQVNPDRTTQFYNQLIISNSTSTTGINAGNKDITNVGKVELDSIEAAAQDMVFDLTDNRAAALDIKEGSNSYLKFVTTNAAEEIVASQDFRVEGNLTVNGETTTVQTATLTVEDKRIVAATPDTDAASNAAQAANASGGGLALDTHLTAGTDDANYAAVTWSSTGDLTGWRFRDTAGATDYAASVMELNLSSANAPTGDSAGIGSFYFAANGSTAGELYIRTL